jgi:hypothetical protein
MLTVVPSASGLNRTSRVVVSVKKLAADSTQRGGHSGRGLAEAYPAPLREDASTVPL